MKHEQFPNEGMNKFMELRKTMDKLWKHRLDIVAALEYAGHSHSFDDVAIRVMSGELVMYNMPNSVMLVEHTQYPNYTVYNVFIAGGDLDEILANEETLIRDGKELGCKYLSMTGRRGWEPTLRKLGWSHDLSIMKKVLDDE